LHISKKNCTFAASKVKGKEITMDESVFITYKTKEEHMEALRRMVGLRKVFEEQVRESRARRQNLQVAQ
jgi:hypothetical protein